ncbi:MAG: bifunctional riboflavin kinase/FAD synthetase [Halobacteriovoraceae bacterium]|jgi:riboflavin kinase / FMN adenylyltransferase|nr:bifunctional riboflavin kinase/FAD synthetase [Halobacteriovoraceae bacterium]
MNLNITSILSNLCEVAGPCGVVIGNFDGVHLGHQKLIKNFLNYCEINGLKSILITFSPHPYIYFNGKSSKYLITSHMSKMNILLQQGINKIVVLDFNKDLQEMPAEKFIDEVLLSISGLKLIYLGHDFKIGKGKKDSLFTLKQKAKEREIEVISEEPLLVSGEVVGSSSIRQMLTDGLIPEVSSKLGRNFCFHGVVERGRGIGSKKLVATANILVAPEKIIPKSGVYATKLYVGGKPFLSLTNIGVNPSVTSENKQCIEVHVLDFSEMIYDEQVSVEFLYRVRDEKKFQNISKLKEQILQDISFVKSQQRESGSTRMALVGKDIKHSLSQSIYENLLDQTLTYDLLDYEREELILPLNILKKTYCGVSITSPYKKYFLNMVNEVKDYPFAINTLVFDGDKVIGRNSDFHAVRDILKEYRDREVQNFYILGDGVMSELTQNILESMDCSFEVLSRNNKKIFNTKTILSNKGSSTLVINCCARSYEFALPVGASFLFWDMNYKQEQHKQLFHSTSVIYEDGERLLALQAKYALSFWNIREL